MNSRITKTRLSLTLLIMFGLQGGVAVGGFRPSFSLEDSSRRATDIVVASEAPATNGTLRVLEVWKGELKADSSISVPELAAFVDKSARTVSPGNRDWSNPSVACFTGSVAYVTGSRMILFLKKSSEPFGKWQPANRFNDMTVSVVWVEQGQAYAFVQVQNPGPAFLVPLGLSEEEMKQEALGIIRTQKAASREK